MSCTGHSHDHEHEDSGVSLRNIIDVPNVYCLNELLLKSGASILKSYSERFQTEPYLMSQRSTDPDDENPCEMLLFIRKFISESLSSNLASIQIH